MQASSPAQSKNPDPFSSLGSDAIVLSHAAVDEAGFKLPFTDDATQGRRGSCQSCSSAGVQSVRMNAFSLPVPQLAYQPADPSVDSNTAYPSTKNRYSAQNSSGAEGVLEDHIQFASYTDDKFQAAKLAPPPNPNNRHSKTWIPLPLRPYFWIPLIVFLLGGAIGLEIALHFSKKNQGWSSGDTDREILVLHYVYTLPPVVVAAILVAMWAWTDFEIKKIQPYVDLVHGDSPPHRSLLLDYTRQNNFLVWTRAASNRHYLVALASLMVILTLSFQPLAAALLVVRDTWWQEPDIAMKNLAAIGLNENLQFNDLTYFLSAAGYSGAAVMYNLPPPAFVRAPYTVAPFELPITVTKNGTAFANTTAIKTETNCVSVSVSMVRHDDASGWTNTATYNECSIIWEVDVSSRILFGTDTPTCPSSPLPHFSPIVFWFFSYIPSARSSAIFCYPTISLLEVNVGVDIATGNVTKVTDVLPLSSSSNFSSFSANVTGAPLYGQAYNGIKFNLTNPDRFVLARQNAIQLQLPAAVYQAANESPEGFSDSFNGTTLTTLSDKIYGTYLSLVARSIYFLPADESINVQVKTFRKRVWLSDVAGHLLATAMIILAFIATIVHLFHREDRRHLRLKHEPGTIASAVSIGAQTGVAEVLDGRQAKKDIQEALRNRKFRIDPVTMKIIMEGEDGYETAESPLYRRRSVFQGLQWTQEPSRKLTKSPTGTSTPPSPRTPNPQTPPRTPTTPRTPDLKTPITPILRFPKSPNLEASGPPA